MALTLDSTIKLASGNLIPRLGYGVYQARGSECEDGVKEAIRVGYRHIDSAQAYRNEDLVAKGVAAAGVPRTELFLTTKYMTSHKPYPADAVYKYLTPSLTKIAGSGQGAYIDLMLLHAPFGGAEGRANNWAAVVLAQKDGWVKDIGVSNFGVKHLKELPAPTPAINQIELHPWCQQRDIVKYCNEHGIVVQAYSPLLQGHQERFGDATITKLCEKHGKEPAQILIRWSLQMGFIPLPKSVTPSRIKSNADVYDFELDPADMAALDALDKGSAGAVTWNPIETD